MEEIKIEIISREIIKPSIPTPFDHKIFHLSRLDQIFPPLHLPLLLVYNNNNICRKHGFKTSNNNADLDMIINTLKVNVFQCGGIVIGCYLIHKLLDAASVGTFLTHWAAVATTRQNGIIQPDFHATVAAFPPVISPPEKVTRRRDYSQHGGAKRSAWVVKSFVFDTQAIKQLKSIGKSEKVPNPSEFEAVAGFTWLHAVVAAQNAKTTAMGSPSAIIFGVNIRPKTRPALPRGAIGNIATNVHARVDDIATVALPQLVAEIHVAISKAKEIAETLQLVGPEAVAAEGPKWGELGKEEGASYNVTSWCKFGLSEIDFGFGKPSQIIPFGTLHYSLKNSIVFVDHNNDDDNNNNDDDNNNGVGIQVWLFLEEDEMRFLESNPLFCEFASLI